MSRKLFYVFILKFIFIFLKVKFLIVLIKLIIEVKVILNNLMFMDFRINEYYLM